LIILFLELSDNLFCFEKTIENNSWIGGGEFAADFFGEAADFGGDGGALGGEDDELGADEAGDAEGCEGEGAEDVSNGDWIGEGQGGFGEFFVIVAEGLQLLVEVEVVNVRDVGRAGGRAVFAGVLVAEWCADGGLLFGVGYDFFKL
jgi:hypothetical protein